MNTQSLSEVFTRLHGRWLAAAALGLALAWLPATALAQEEPPAEEAAEEEEATAEEEGVEGVVTDEITVTGTRVEGRTATDTPSPVDIINAEAIERSGATETGKILQLLAPSFNFSTTFISDGTDSIRPATLRALGSDQVLILVNGKRRHTTAHVNVQQTIARGESGTDINAIPASAIERIEVLRDGAAAQYGSDAIAGVINIILKSQTNRSDVSLDVGQTYESDGEVFTAAANTGWGLGAEGFLNLSVEYRDRGETNRAGIADTNLLGWYSAADFAAGRRDVKLRIGDSDAQDALVWLNAAIPAGAGELYAFGGYSQRETNSSGFYRGPADGRTVPALYPDGFLPTIITEPTDTSLVAGYKAPLGGGSWSWDVSANYGASEFAFREENTVNVSYWFEPTNPANPTGPRFAASPTAADTGTLKFDQLALNLDFKGEVDWGFGEGPLFVALGAEWREEGYQIEPGDEVSYEYGRTDNRAIQIFNQTGTISQPGMQGFPGWSPREAVNDDRNNTGLYLDLESPLSERLLAGLALRFEDYSDFGSTVNGKLSGRFDLSDRVSLRGTLSSGFRAPSVQQQFFSQRSTNLNSAGVLTDTLTARQGGDVTRAFGVPALDEETSQSYSFGLVGKPSENFRLTVDVYRIDIDDRIVFSSNIGLGTSAAIDNILNGLNVGQVLFFTNAIDTQTDGLDVVALYDWTLGPNSLLSLEGAFHFNDTEVTARRSSSSILPAPVLFDNTQVTLIEEGQPSEHYVLSGTWYAGDWTTNLRFNYFGEVAGQGFTPGFTQTWGAKWLTDLSIGYNVTDDLKFTVGGLNIFDEYPDDWDAVNAFPFPQLGFTYGWETLPFGLNGGYYFARLSYRFDH